MSAIAYPLPQEGRSGANARAARDAQHRGDALRDSPRMIVSMSVP
ncbi:MAG: hypothetical protein OJF61_001409 [Rhodanobacteraceae bacterium]|jgi:hypothetical protein|nr:MAG: hypothetical protein OJF61_001409 [Rhodanobacteraceae bacterium]